MRDNGAVGSISQAIRSHSFRIEAQPSSAKF
jgi:hypothetical protein